MLYNDVIHDIMLCYVIPHYMFMGVLARGEPGSPPRPEVSLRRMGAGVCCVQKRPGLKVSGGSQRGVPEMLLLGMPEKRCFIRRATIRTPPPALRILPKVSERSASAAACGRTERAAARTLVWPSSCLEKGRTLPEREGHPWPDTTEARPPEMHEYIRLHASVL